MQANPYVYPFIPFQDLSNKNFLDNFTADQFITTKDLSKLIAALPIVQPRISSQDINSRLLDIFLDENYCYGPKENIQNNLAFWHERFDYFTKQQAPIHLIILGFPFKIPVPLKTNRTMPDMGEALSLHRLFTITQLVKEIYPPGATLTIFTEGVFGKFTDVQRDEWIAYRERLQYLIDILDYQNSLFITDLEETESLAPDFQKRYEDNVQKFKKQFADGEVEAIKKYDATFPSVYRLVSSHEYPYEDLLDVYNDDLPDNAVTQSVLEIRRELRHQAHESIFKYHAYHQTRYDTSVMDKAAPNAIYLTVSPKVGRLGIYPIAREVNRLPYHGVPVWHESKKYFDIEYLVDIRRQPGPYTKIFLRDDPEQQPFYYIV
ncbi:L-tyrosine/L-tryptophan isonitrile synthase family protein [Candidatus Peregrinibacteria bacterium]|nr:L-tyrosine/L-tryptophan isonitrile synthase family protein [Candidatus Peregrinibacteria bacterium]